MDEQKPRGSLDDTSSASEPSDAREGSDVVLVHGVTPDGNGLQVIRARDSRLEAGAVYPLREGQPVHGDIVRLKPRAVLAARPPASEHTPSEGTEKTSADEARALVCEVEVLVRSPHPSQTPAADERELTRGKGPAKVSSAAYRSSWERIFGPRGGGGSGGSGSSAPN